MKVIIDQHFNRKKLQALLDYEIGGSVLFFLHYMALPMFLIIPPFLHRFISIVILAGLIVFTLFMFKVLIHERRTGWIIFFFLIVILPGIAAYFFLSQAEWIRSLGNALMSTGVSVAGLFVYCSMLRLTIPTWYFYDEE